MKKQWALNYLLSAQWRLWSDWVDGQADLSLRWVHMSFCWFRCAAAYIFGQCKQWQTQLLCFFNATTSKKLTGHIGVGCPCVGACIQSKHACHILWTLHARALKFHLWIPHEKVADTCLFFWSSCLPFWSYAPLKKSEWNLMHAISYEPCMLGFWNFIYGFLMEK